MSDKTRRVTSVQEKSFPPTSKKKKKKNNRGKESTGFVSTCHLQQKALRNQENIRQQDTKNGRKEGHSKLLLKLQAWNSLRNSNTK